MPLLSPFSCHTSPDFEAESRAYLTQFLDPVITTIVVYLPVSRAHTFPGHAEKEGTSHLQADTTTTQTQA